MIVIILLAEEFKKNVFSFSQPISTSCYVDNENDRSRSGIYFRRQRLPRNNTVTLRIRDEQQVVRDVRYVWYFRENTQ